MQYFNLGGGNSIRFATGTSAPSVDPDAQAFITAAAITDPTQQSAVNQLVVDLKGYGVWTKMKALYPFVGGTASQHKFNLKDPRDLDAAFRLVFFGGITHSTTGVTGNGTNGYFDTKYNDLDQNILGNSSAWAYSTTNIARNSDVLFGTFDTVNNATFINPRNASNLTGSRHQNIITSTTSNTDSRGFYGVNRTSNANYSFYKNNTKTVISEISLSLNTTNFTGFYFSSGPIYAQRNINFLSLGSGLTDTEAANFYTAVQTFQTTLNRQIP
jgi:hypothetical protein